MTLSVAGVPEVEAGEFPCAEARKELSDGRGDEGEE